MPNAGQRMVTESLKTQVAAPHVSNLQALDGLNFFLAALLTGFGPFIALHLTDYEWNPAHIGLSRSLASDGTKHLFPLRFVTDSSGLPKSNGALSDQFSCDPSCGAAALARDSPKRRGKRLVNDNSNQINENSLVEKNFLGGSSVV